MLNILNVAQSGLKTSQTQVENVMNNLANESTPGYKKRVVNVSEIEQNDSRVTGRGVSIEDVSRITNIYMYQNLIKSGSTLSSTNELNSMLADIESIFTETDNAGLSADINNYFNSIENLRTSPTNEVYKNDVINNAKLLVSDLQNIYSNIEEKEKTTISNIKENVDEVNKILKEIGNINKKITESSGANPNELLDKRDNLEKELAQYVDVEISRDATYQLKIAGINVISQDTNVNLLNLVEEYKSQKDIYAKTDPNTGITYTNPIQSSLVDSSTWDGTYKASEVQTISISGLATSSSIDFLGSKISVPIGANPTQVATAIDSKKNDIIDEWNKNNPNREIANNPVGSGISISGSTITITYDELEGDVEAIDNVMSNGINFTGSVETTKGKVDSLKYTINNEFSIKVTYGETLYEMDGVTPADINNDGIVDTNDKVNKDNIVQAMVYKINQNSNIGSIVTAYNGQYEIAEDGSKILTNDSRHSEFDPKNPNKDRYLVIESQKEGETGSFVGEFVINDSNISTTNNLKTAQEKNDYLSQKAIDDLHIEIYEDEVSLSGGSLKSMLDNVSTNSDSNIFNQFKEQLDQFAKTLSNLTSSYIENDDQTFVYGTNAVDLSADEDKKVLLNLFSGADVKSLKFNASSINKLTQDKLDYLATLQWKDDIDFDGTGLNNQSFSKFYQTLRVNVADNKENTAFTQESQEAVNESIQNAYDKITKVDKDAEMIELIKFQSAYEANAKMVTIVDEMLQTLLGMKR